MAGTPTPAPARRPGGRLLLGCLLVVAAAYGLYSRCHALMRPPGQDVGINGMVARNHLKYGFPDLGLAQIVSPGAVLEQKERIYYQTHPPLAPVLGALGIAAFGPSAAALRLPHLLVDVAVVVVLAWYTTMLYGRAAGLWCAIAAAALPMSSTFSFVLACPVGPPLVLCVCLAALSYYRYAQSGEWRYYWALFGATVLGLLTDWPAYLMCFVVAGHALLYRTKAKKLAMAALPAAALVVAAALVLYAHASPTRQQLYGGIRYAFAGWAAGDQLVYSPAQWLVNAGRTFVQQFSPLAIVALVWLAFRAPRAALTRENSRDQHVLMLWIWPLPFVVVFHRIFYSHVHYHLLFLPAVAVTLGAAAGRLYDGTVVRGRRIRAGVAAACCAFLLLWSHHVVSTTEELRSPVRKLNVEWAKDIAQHSALGDQNAFVLHYAMQMRFLADRLVRQEIDTAEKLEELRSAIASKVARLFVPLSYPFGEASFGRFLISRFDVRAGQSTLFFLLERPKGAPEVPVHRLGPVELSGGVCVEQIEFASFATADGRPFLWLGPTVRGLPSVRPGERVEWRLRFVGGDGRCWGTAAVPARTSASYFIPAPTGWSLGWGRVELVLRHQSWDAEPAGLHARLSRLAVRLCTLGWLGRRRRTTTEFLIARRSPLVLSPPPSSR